MKLTSAILLALLAVTVAVVCIICIVRMESTRAPQPPHAVCLQSHREVVFIPTICGAHDICQKPVVTDVCDRIQAPPPRPMCQGNNDDD